MVEMICLNCKYFQQHYVRCGGEFAKAGCGHCTERRVKTRLPYSKACDKFEQKR
ncbi:MAG: hypothetical protein Q4C72_08595 [Eubacteriales bacterium]|nr:hypothetical protein [Eubacteriales bacterium]